MVESYNYFVFICSYEPEDFMYPLARYFGLKEHKEELANLIETIELDLYESANIYHDLY